MKTLVLFLLSLPMFAQLPPPPVVGGSCPDGDPVCACSDWTGIDDAGAFSFALTDGSNHPSGKDHWLDWTEIDSCSYRTGPQLGSGNWACFPTASVNETITSSGDTQGTLSPYDAHFGTGKGLSLSIEKTIIPYTISAQGGMAFTIEGCTHAGGPLGDGCLNPTITWEVAPVTPVITNEPYPVYNYAGRSHLQTCPQHTATSGTPIVIPIDPSVDYATAFTDVDHGITWDWAGNKHPVRMSWIDPTVRMGVLAMTRDNGGKGGPSVATVIKDGVTTVTVNYPCDPQAGKCPIRSGRELFGSMTNQVADPKDHLGGFDGTDRQSNGFEALRKLTFKDFDGLGRPFIGPGDPAWSHLFVCVSFDPSTGVCAENYTMADLHITAINLQYKQAAGSDGKGNRFAFVGSMVRDGKVVPVVDVVFQMAPVQ